MRWILLLLPIWLGAQGSHLLDEDFRFRDGVYFAHATLVADRPDAGWEAIDGEMVQLAEDFRVQIDNFGYKEGNYVDPYAIVLDGKAYLFVRKDSRRDFHEFAGLRILGGLSTIEYDTLVTNRQLMKAYNPANGLAFREAWIERDRRQTVRRVVDMASGRRFPLERSAVMRLLAAETDLVQALEQTPPDDDEKLRRALKIYNGRHPFTLPVEEPNR